MRRYKYKYMKMIDTTVGLTNGNAFTIHNVLEIRETKFFVIVVYSNRDDDMTSSYWFNRDAIISLHSEVINEN